VALPIDVVDPGQVNVETQAYPIVPPGSQGGPVPQEAFAFLGAFPIVPPGLQGIPVPTVVNVANIPALPASFRLGVPDVTNVKIDIGVQIITRLPVTDIVVTESGNFQTNVTPGIFQSFTITAVSTDVNGNLILTFGPGVNFFNFGVNLIGRNLFLPSSVNPLSPENIPARLILFFNTLSLLVSATDLNGNALPVAPVGGNVVNIDVQRFGSEAINDTFPTESNVTISPSPPVAATVPAAPGVFLGNFQARSGVVSPFIGSGIQAPPFLGTFEVEDQSLVRGLAVNVNVS
jgi:hypothetical protein